MKANMPCVVAVVLMLSVCLLMKETSAFLPTNPNRVDASRFGVAKSLPFRMTTRSSVAVAQSKKGGGTSSNADFLSSSPLRDPVLATLDVVCLLGFAAIGKASHAANGSIDPSAVLITGFPFVTAWLATSPFTGIYSKLLVVPDAATKVDIAKQATIQTAKGWALAIPLGCALRGIIKGYVPPLPFVMVTLVATLVILVTVRVLYAVATTLQD
jgi:Protein of unknown function (DUF3054)